MSLRCICTSGHLGRVIYVALGKQRRMLTARHALAQSAGATAARCRAMQRAS